MIARLICYFRGHKRGVRVKTTEWLSGIDIPMSPQEYYCPRCFATWTRKVSQRKAKGA